MYRQYWGLPPEFLAPNPSHHAFFPCAAQEEALARVQFLVDEGHHLGILVGESGLGKSTRFTQIAQQRREQRLPVAQINAIGMDYPEFLVSVGAALGARGDLKSPPARIWRRLLDQCWANQQFGLSTVLMVDDAHDADTEVLTAIERLTQWFTDRALTATVFLSTVPDRTSLLGGRLRELCDLRIELERWTVEDSTEFLARSARESGATAPLFDDEAAAELHRRSEGNPRRLRQMAELALVAGAGLEQRCVDLATVTSLEGEFPWSAAAALA